MPYFFETQKIKLPKAKDRRYHLTDIDQEDIREMHRLGVPIRGIARKYEGQCSRRLIQFVIFPERSEAAKKNWHWKKYYNTKKNTVAAREHRIYKNKILMKVGV